jgi:protein gp37
VKADAAEIARAKGYTSLVSIAEKMAGHVGQHCEHVPWLGCEHCYAETNNHRCLPGNGTGLPYDRRSRDLVEAFVDEKVLLQPLGWKPGRPLYDAETGKVVGRDPAQPRKIFVENQSDLFAEWVTDEMLDRIFAVMALCPQHIFQVLTKRPERMLAYILTARNRLGEIIFVNALRGYGGLDPEKWRHSSERPWPLPNIWLGVTAENQTAADERVPLLLQTPAAVRYVSCEPLLGLLDLWKVDVPARWLPEAGQYAGWDWHDFNGETPGGLDWVIAGGESGPGARPMHPDWARSLRDQCAAAGTAFFFKQWGEWAPTKSEPVRDKYTGGGIFLRPDGVWGQQGEWWDGKAEAMDKVGKKAAGSLLDGVEHKAFPEVRG